LKKARGQIRLSRDEAAQYLARLSGSMADGLVRLEAGDVRLPDTLTFNWKFREKDGSVSLEFSFKGTRNKAVRTKDKREKIGDSEKRPYEAKKVKKALAGYWKEIKRSVKEESLPADMESVSSLLAQYGKMARPEWKDQWAACQEKILMLLGFLEKGDFKQAAQLTGEIDRLIKICHKAYK